MQKYYINYANDDFKNQQAENARQVKEIGGIENVICYTPKDIDDDFYQANKKILNKTRGAGYWLWKFYIIHKTLTDPKLKDGDVLFYCDSGVNVLKDINPIYDLPEKYNQDIVLFSQTVAPEVYPDMIRSRVIMKRDAFILMNCDEEGAYNAPMVAGGYHVWRKSEKSIKFIKACLVHTCNEDILLDTPSKLGRDLPEYCMHRHDQCVLSMVAYMMGVRVINNADDGVFDTEVKNANDKNINFDNPKTYLIPNRVHNRGWWRRQLYKIAMLPEKIAKRGGVKAYLKKKMLRKKDDENRMMF